MRRLDCNAKTSRAACKIAEIRLPLADWLTGLARRVEVARPKLRLRSTVIVVLKFADSSTGSFDDLITGSIAVF
jgi:hypothetical protein